MVNFSKLNRATDGSVHQVLLYQYIYSAKTLTTIKLATYSVQNNKAIQKITDCTMVVFWGPTVRTISRKLSSFSRIILV